MNDHFFVLMYATSGEERNVTRFASYTNVQDVAIASRRKKIHK